MTDQLRSLLRQAVPDDAPALDPNAVAGAARRARRRSRAVVAGTVAATVLAAGALAAVTTGEEDRAAQDPALDPYAAPACPDSLPELEDATTEIGSLQGLSSVRLCPDLDAVKEADQMTIEQKRSILGSMDALVGDVSGFGSGVAALEPFDPGRCATILVINTRQSVQLTFDDGRSVLLPTASCSPIEMAGQTVDGQYLGEVYLDALDGQRNQTSATHSYDGPLGCSELTVPGPARPGREQVVAAAACIGGAEPVELTGAALARLQEAWANPGSTDGRVCTLVDMDIRVVAATDRGDVVSMRVTCGTLEWDGWKPGESADVPVTPADLGLTP